MGRMVEFIKAQTIGAGTTHRSSAMHWDRGILNVSQDYLAIDVDVNVNVGAGIEAVTLSLEGSPNGTTWYPLALLDMSAPALARVPLTVTTAGDITASTAATQLFIAGASGVIPSAGFTLGTTGLDASDPLLMVMNVLINTVSIFAVQPALDQAAADGSTTFVAGAGVTVGVVDPLANIVAAGDIITYSFALTRNGAPAPDDEMADRFAAVELAYNTAQLGEFVFSKTFAVDTVGQAVRFLGWRPYVRAVVVNSGANPAVVTALGYAR